MSNKFTNEKKHKINWVITLLSFFMCVALLGAFAVGAFNMPAKTTDDVGVFGWGVGAVDDNGKVIESRRSIYTKDVYKVNELEIKLDEDATVTYKVAFYDEDKKFVSVSDELSEDYDTELTPETAKYFRVIVTPYQVDGEDVIVTAFTVNKYAKQLEVIYQK